MHILIILGSIREGRIGKKVASWFMIQLKNYPDLFFEFVDLKDWDLPLEMEKDIPSTGIYAKPQSKKWAAKIAAADGYIFITPEYNHGYPAALKNAIDYVYAEWQKKPVAFVGYGVRGAVNAIDQLVPVLTRLNMVPLTTFIISIRKVSEAFNDSGEINPELVTGSAERLVENLAWWTKALKTARKKG